jgi:hypothetical protein
MHAAGRPESVAIRHGVGGGTFAAAAKWLRSSVGSDHDGAFNATANASTARTVTKGGVRHQYQLADSHHLRLLLSRNEVGGASTNTLRVRRGAPLQLGAGNGTAMPSSDTPSPGFPDGRLTSMP